MSDEVANRDGPRRCVICDRPLRSKQKLACSIACSNAWQRRNVNQAVKDEVSRLCAGGLTRKEIAGKLGLSYTQVKRCSPKMTKEEIAARQKRGYSAYRHSSVPRTSPKAKAPEPRKVRVRTPKPTEVVQPPPKREPILIHPHEIRIAAALLGLPRHKYDDLDAVARAKKRENPNHPGYRLFTPG